MLSVKIEGLDKMQKEFKDAQRAIASLNGEITRVTVTPGDPESVKSAIRKMESAVDGKVSAYRNNALVAPLAKAAKDQF